VLGGLRLRLVAALLTGSAVTLAVAAALLLQPLESRLLDDEAKSLVRAVRADRPSLTRLEAGDLQAGEPALAAAARSLRRRTGGEVTILLRDGVVLAQTDPDEPLGPLDPQAVRTKRTTRTVIRSAGEVRARVILPVTVHRVHLVVAAERRLNDARDAVGVVRRAFLSAAAISLGIALLLGLVMAGRLVRRLRSLRDTALHVAELGPVVEMRADTTRDEVGDLTRAFVTMQDRLREQERARRSFVATASHELRTPLSSLRVTLDLLLDDLGREDPDVADARVQAKRADAQAERLAHLAGNLLDLSRIDAGIPIRRELVDMGEVVRSVLAEFELRARESRHRLTLRASSSLWATGDPDGVAQLVRILVDNALSHGPAGGAVGVEVGPGADGTVVLSITDAGRGIAPEDRDRIFERFERGTSASPTPGFGLGLAIGRELAVRMSGELVLDADAGEATVFRLTLPGAPAS
jgi:signal transduction histidine kinase